MTKTLIWGTALRNKNARDTMKLSARNGAAIWMPSSMTWAVDRDHFAGGRADRGACRSGEGEAPGEGAQDGKVAAEEEEEDHGEGAEERGRGIRGAAGPAEAPAADRPTSEATSGPAMSTA